MKNYNKRLSALVIGGITTLAITGLPYTVLAVDKSTKPVETYLTANISQLNETGVTGTAVFETVSGTASTKPSFKVDLKATGTVPGKTHPVHIHGKLSKEVALCPTTSADVNKDDFISVVEGAPAYGPIKANLTSPQTPFGPSPTPLLFAPFAGTADNNNFPKSNANGDVSLSQTYEFDSSEAAQEAMESILPLKDQAIVVHGGMAPASVDADAFAALGMPITGSPTAVVYDVLLPVACGDISEVANDAPVTPAPMPTPPVQDMPKSDTTAVTNFQTRIDMLKSNFDNAAQAAQAKFETDRATNKGEARDRYIGTLQSARDLYINQFFEARNQLVDQLNRSGSTELRNTVTTNAEKKLNKFSEMFEVSKKEFVENTNL